MARPARGQRCRPKRARATAWTRDRVGSPATRPSVPRETWEVPAGRTPSGWGKVGRRGWLEPGLSSNGGRPRPFTKCGGGHARIGAPFRVERQMPRLCTRWCSDSRRSGGSHPAAICGEGSDVRRSAGGPPVTGSGGVDRAIHCPGARGVAGSARKRSTWNVHEGHHGPGERACAVAGPLQASGWAPRTCPWRSGV